MISNEPCVRAAAPKLAARACRSTARDTWAALAGRVLGARHRGWRIAFAAACIVVVFGTLARGQDDAAFTVFREHLPDGPQITPYLRYLCEEAWQLDAARQKRFDAVHTEADVKALQDDLRRNLVRILGGFPETRSPLNAEITGTIQCVGYRIEKVLFESFPGYKVTALVYRPEGKGPFPAALVPCGHAPIGKAWPAYQEIAARLALRGYVALCWDPVGQGERSQYWDAAKGESRYNRVCGEHAVIGNLANLVGANLARWEVWDGMRALDYLQSRPDVSKDRAVITGTSGGGFQTAFIMALDPRITAAAPSCYISSLPMRMANRIFEDPDTDPEQDVPGFLSAGVGHPGLGLLMYPRPVAFAFAALDFFPIEGSRRTFREVEAIYRRFGHGDRIMSTIGFHTHGYSEFNQSFTLPFLDKGHDAAPREIPPRIKTFTDPELHVTRTGQVLLDYPHSMRFTDLLKHYHDAHAGAANPSLTQLYHGPLYPGIDHWKIHPYVANGEYASIAVDRIGDATFKGHTLHKIALHHSGRLALPLLVIEPTTPSNGKSLLWLGFHGKVSADTWSQIQPYLDQGYRVYSWDFRGQGENAMRYAVTSVDDPSLLRPWKEQYFNPISGVMENYVINSLLIGRPYFLQMIEDVEIVSRFAKSEQPKATLVIAGADAYATVAHAAAEVLPGLRQVKSTDGTDFSWKAAVENATEDWPVEFMLPGGAYIR